MGNKKNKITTIRTEVHKLIDDLPETDIYLLLRVIKGLKDSSPDLLQHLLHNAPCDDELLTKDEHILYEEVRMKANNDGILSHQEILKEFGLSN